MTFVFSPHEGWDLNCPHVKGTKNASNISKNDRTEKM